MKLKISAFSFVDLMVTLLIAGILAGVAVPMYGAYSRKVKVSEGYQMLDVVSKAQATYFINNKEFRFLVMNPLTSAPSGSKYILPRPVNSIGDAPSWADLGTPIPVGSKTFFEYQALPGKTDASGNNVLRSGSTLYNTTDKLLYGPTFSGSRWTGEGVKKCDQYYANEFVSPSGKSQYNWVLIMAFANLKEDTGNDETEHCTQLFRLVDTNERSIVRSNPVIARYPGE